MRPEEIAAVRLRSQLLRGPGAGSPREVVRRFGAMQGQEFGPALWAVAQRTAPGPARDESALLAAFDAGELLRTHVVRPTWHLVAPEDLRWVLAATAHRVHQANKPQYRSFGVDDVRVDTTALIARALGGGVRATRTELAEVLRGHGVDAAGPLLAHLVMRAELDGAVVSGERRNGQQTYAAFDERVPPGPWPERAEAQAILARVWVASRGPGTLKDLVRWAGLTATEARAAVEAAGVEEVELGGRRYLVAPGTLDEPAGAGPEPVVDLLQSYDEMVMAYSESRDVLIGDAPVQEGDVPFLHMVLFDGQLAGHWRPVRGKDELTVELMLHRDPGAAGRRALGRALEALGEYHGLPVRSVEADVRRARRR